MREPKYPVGTIPEGTDLELLAHRLSYMRDSQVGPLYGRSARTIRRWKAILERRGLLDEKGAYFPEGNLTDYAATVPVLEVDTALILGDAEIPDHDPEIFDMAVRVADLYDVRTLILNGDFLAMDTFSSWARQVVYRLAFADELCVAGKTLQIFLRHFSRIVWLTGNHERRLPFRYDGQVTLGQFLERLSGVQFTEHAHCVVKSGGRTITVVHPDNYSQRPLAVAYKLASIRLTNIVCGHNHHLAFGYDASGEYWIVDGGHCRSANKTAYKTLRVNTHPAWNPGFVLINKGMPELIDKNNFLLFVERAEKGVVSDG